MPGYMAYLLTVLCMVYIVDEIASNICNSLQSDMVTQFYVNAKGLDFNTGLATYSAMTAPLYVLMVITQFYKSLADRYGRKLLSDWYVLYVALTSVCLLFWLASVTASSSVACGLPQIFFSFCFPANQHRLIFVFLL